MDARNALDLQVEVRQVYVSEQACNRRTEGDAQGGLMRSTFVLVKEADALFQQPKEIVLGFDQAGELCKQQFVIDGGKVVGDITLDRIKRRLV